jgi:serine phosphatase RsbU (regulator of sigma subunit)
MLEIKADGNLNKRAEVENNDEVGHIAQVFNEFLYAISELKQELADKLVVLENYQTYNEQEQRIASGSMNKLIALDKIRDTDVQFYLKPAENFSGDLIAVSRTPDNRLHLLLADSTGHGLSAALAAMPLIHPFYSMTSKGFSISAIAKEINTKVWHSLPVSHFVAAILVSIDAKADMVEVWSGGCPPPVILNSKGECEHRFKPRHLAMGILRPDEFDDSVEYFTYTEGSSLMMFSDGVTELENEQGEEFGVEGVLNAVRGPDAATRWENITSTIKAYGGVDNDDIALMIAQFNFHGRKVSQRESVPLRLQQGQGSVIWQFALTLDIVQIKKLDVVPLLLDIVQQIEKDKARGGEIFMILSEMFNNALDHGILKLDSSMKHHAEGMEKYFEERAVRLENAVAGQIRLNLERVINEDGHTLLRIDIKDSGDGFDFKQLSQKIADSTLRHGRGIALLYNTCSVVHFLGNGSEVLVEFDLQGGQKQDAQ